MTSDSANPGGPFSERRSGPRYTFIATADIIEPSTGAKLSGRISEISDRGCYIDILNTLPKDTLIRVRITTDRGSFECAGRIIYVHEQIGVGIGFTDVAKDQQELLDSWLRELSGQA